MVQQILILSFLYVLGVLFAALFYPKLSINLIVSSGLFWGGLIHTAAGILLGFFGWYQTGIWMVLAVLFIILVYINLRRRPLWKNAAWHSLLKSFDIMLALYLLTYLVFGRQNQLLTSSASFPYFILGSRIYNYGTIFIDGAGFDFRTQYGMSEAMMHALANFIDLPVMSLWHPFLWISQYAFLFYVILEYSKRIRLKTLIAVGIALLTIIWTATSSMNWLQSFYIHVHLFSSFALLIAVSFFWRILNSSSEEPGLALLSALALCGYGLSRVESPMFILIVLAIFYISKKLCHAEYRALFYPPLLMIMIWLAFVYIAYKGTESQCWTDSRLLVAIGTYVLVFLFLLIKDLHGFELDLAWIKKVFMLRPVVGGGRPLYDRSPEST